MTNFSSQILVVIAKQDNNDNQLGLFTTSLTTPLNISLTKI